MEEKSVTFLGNDTIFNFFDTNNSDHRLVVENRQKFGNDSRNTSLPFSIVEHVQIILPYALILLLAVVGNVLVIVTLAVNKHMRTVTNVFLFNMAISDLLLGVFCMPFTLVGVLLRAFVFGEAMCRMIPYLQAVSVSVGAWTLVAMSVERYYAICHPLKSRQWQTFSHAKKMICIVWIASLLYMLPIAVLSQLQPLKGNGQKFKCRESWPSDVSEKIFNILIDVFLFLIPLSIMIVTYSMICYTLWKALSLPIIEVKSELIYKKASKSNVPTNSSSSVPLTKNLSAVHSHKSLTQKKRVIKMLFVVVMEFFISWTPLYIINTISLFDPMAVYLGLGYHGIGFFQLLAYTSSCCNPITYCFMNSKFRQNFIAIFGCRGRTIAMQESSASVIRSGASISKDNNTVSTAFT